MEGWQIILIGYFVFFIAGIVLIILYPIIKKKNSRCSEQAQATLTEKHKKDTGFVYVYSYSVNGVEYKLTTPTCSPQVDSIGDECIIWYNPTKPNDALAYHYKSVKVFKILFIIGIVMVIMSLSLPILGIIMSTIQN